MAGTLYTAIDIGSRTVKVVSLRRSGTSCKIVGAGMSHIPDMGADEKEDSLQVISLILKNIIKCQKIPLGHPVAGLGGRHSLLRYMSVPIVPPWKLSMLMAYEIEEHRASSGEIAFDYRILNLPDFEEGQFSVMLAQAQEAAVDNILDICKKGAGRAEEIDINSIAAHNLYISSTDFDEDEISLCLDIGASETSVSMQQGNALFFVRSISHGGDKFTANISKALGISKESAEELKISKGRIISPEEQQGISDESEVELVNACKAEAGALASAVQSSIVFFRNQLLRTGSGRTVRLSKEKERVFRPEKIYITGGGAGLKGLDTYLGERMRLPCKVLDLSILCENLSGSAELAINPETVNTYASPIGLALGRAMASGTTMSLITPSEQERRKFWRETAFAYGAGILGLLIIFLSVYFSYIKLSQESEISEKWEKGIKQAKEKKNEYLKLQKENKRLYSMTSALDQRIHAPLDMLKAVALIKESSTSEFFFTGIESDIKFDTFVEEGKDSSKGKASQRARRGRARSSKPAEKTSDKEMEDAFSNCKIIVEGYCFDKDKAEASKKITKLAENLESHKSNLFIAVTQEYGRWIDDPEELAPFFETPGESALKIKRPGSAFQFRFECWIRDS